MLKEKNVEWSYQFFLNFSLFLCTWKMGKRMALKKREKGRICKEKQRASKDRSTSQKFMTVRAGLGQSKAISEQFLLRLTSWWQRFRYLTHLRVWLTEKWVKSRGMTWSQALLDGMKACQAMVHVPTPVWVSNI